MMVVISNTSPLTNLAAIGQFYLLHQLYGRLWIAEAVWQELNAGGQSWPGRDEVAGAVWITRQVATNRPLVTTLREHLDHGEAETIALAVEYLPPFILMDEKEGRHTAQRFGFKTVGVVGGYWSHLWLGMANVRGIEPVRPAITSIRARPG